MNHITAIDQENFIALCHILLIMERETADFCVTSVNAKLNLNGRIPHTNMCMSRRRRDDPLVHVTLARKIWYPP